MGLFDKNIGEIALTTRMSANHTDAHILMALPELYKRGREGKLFGMKPFLIFILEGVYQVSLRLIRNHAEVVSPLSSISLSSIPTTLRHPARTVTASVNLRCPP